GFRLRPAELPVEARPGRQIAHRGSHEACARRHAGPSLEPRWLATRLTLGRRLTQESANVRAFGGRPRSAHALAPVYERRPSRRNHDARTNAATVPRMSRPRPSGSSRPAITCAGTVTATPIGTALDSVMRSQPG